MATMTKLLAVVLVVSGLSLGGVHAQNRPMGDLRSVLKQGVQSSGGANQRQLSAEERAELRRQLNQHSRRSGKGA